MEVEKLEEFLWARICKSDKDWLVKESVKRDRQIGYLVRVAVKRLRKDIEAGDFIPSGEIPLERDVPGNKKPGQ